MKDAIGRWAWVLLFIAAGCFVWASAAYVAVWIWRR